MKKIYHHDTSTWTCGVEAQKAERKRHAVEHSLLRTKRKWGFQIQPWKSETEKLQYLFGQGVGAIPDVGLLKVDLFKFADMIGSSCSFWRHRNSKENEGKAAAKEDPDQKAPHPTLQEQHGSQSKVVTSTGHTTTAFYTSEREYGHQKRETSTGKAKQVIKVDCKLLPLRWFSLCREGG